MGEFIDGWIADERGNKCSVGYFGSEDAARQALASLKNCDNCLCLDQKASYIKAKDDIGREHNFEIHQFYFVKV